MLIQIVPKQQNLNFFVKNIQVCCKCTYFIELRVSKSSTLVLFKNFKQNTKKIFVDEKLPVTYRELLISETV